MIKAIIFDCFGVLVRSGWLPFREEHFGHDPDLLQQAKDISHMKDAGLLTYVDFIKAEAELAGVGEEEARRKIEDNPVNTQLFEWIRDELKPQYKIGMLSNAGVDRLDMLFEPWQVGLFDEKVLSYQIGVTKPDPIAYETIAERLGVLPQECLFVDDQEYYCNGAQAAGMFTVYYQDNLHFIKEMEKYNIHIKKT